MCLIRSLRRTLLRDDNSRIANVRCVYFVVKDEDRDESGAAEISIELSIEDFRVRLEERPRHRINHTLWRVPAAFILPQELLHVLRQVSLDQL